MQRNHLAVGLKHGRVGDDIHWTTVESATEQPAPRDRHALRTVHGLMIGVPLSLALWALIGIALLS